MCPGEIVRIRHLLIRRDFREKCIFMDNDYIKSFLFLYLFVWLSSNLKLSIDIFIMTVRHEFAHSWIHEALLFKIKAWRFVDILSAHK